MGLSFLITLILLSLSLSLSPRGGGTRQGVVLTDLQSLLDRQQNLSLSLSLFYLLRRLGREGGRATQHLRHVPLSPRGNLPGPEVQSRTSGGQIRSAADKLNVGSCGVVPSLSPSPSPHTAL